MAKYCVKCGKALPDGVEICPDCNIPGEQSSDAALFTRMTAETEVWKEDTDQSKKRRRAKIIRSNRQRIGLYSTAVLLVAFTVFIIYFTTPSSNVVRALRNSEYDKALEIYISKLADKEERSSRIDKAIVAAAERTCAAYAADEMEAEEADRVFAALSGFGDDVVYLLEDMLFELESYKSSRDNMEAGDSLYAAGEYLAAYDLYAQVPDTDTHYEEAAAQMALCLEGYADSVLSLAGEAMLADDYVSAAAILREGNDVLDGYGTYSEKIDNKLLECLSLYESYILTEAKNLAELEDYSAAAELILTCTRDFGYETDSLLAALETYTEQAADKVLTDAIAKAEECYESGAYAESFAALESAEVTEGERAEQLNSAIMDMESRFTEDMLAAAEEIFADKRDNVPDALDKLDEALAIRELEALQEYRDALELLLPVSLVEMMYKAKEGDVYRSDSDFDGLDDVTYTDGWIWGDDDAWMSFDLGGNYNLLTGTYITRTDDNHSATARFQIWCDGELAYESDKLYHWETESITVEVDVTGCQELKIVFLNEYEVSTADGGYCYHGFCGPTIIKNFDEAE